MIFIFLQSLIVHHVVFVKFTDAAYFSDVYWSTAIKLLEYDGFKSASILSFNVPPQSTEVTFSFQAKTSGKSCAFREIHIYLQHGSYPLVRPYNETFPPKFFTKRTDLFHIKIQKDADAVSYTLTTPRPGLWYMAAFLPKPSSDKIQQKGFDESCVYGMFIIVESSGLDNVEEISTYETHNIQLSQQTGSDSALYRFKIPEDTVEYKAVVTDCVVTLLDDEPAEPADSNLTINNTTFHTQHAQSANGTSDNLKLNLDNTSDTDLVNRSFATLEPSSTTTAANVSTTASTNPTPLILSSTTSSNKSTTPADYSAATTTTTTSTTTKSTTPTTTPKPAPSVSSNCPITLVLESEMMPSLDSESKVKCGNLSDCSVSVISPNVKAWHYVLMQIDNDYNVSDLQIKISFRKKACQSMKFMVPKIIYMATRGLTFAGDPVHLAQDNCIKMNSLGRFILDEMTYNVTFLLSDTALIPVPTMLEEIFVPDYEVLVTSIAIQEFTDIGGTLKLCANLNTTSFDASVHQVVIYLCLMKNSIPGGQTIRSCTYGVQVVLNSTSSATSEIVYIPYPESGSWFLGLNSQCFDKTTLTPVRCGILPKINMDIGISGCIEGQCGEYGVCRDYISGVNVFSSCKCFAGWRGYGCTDGTDARSREHELMAALLLTLSNLFFIPAIVLAAYRRYFVESAIYAYTMFFSTFYHACDASDLLYYCMLDYDVLSFADFLGSISSFWVTMLAMSKIPFRLRSFAQMLGALGVAVGVEYDRHGLWVFAVPAGLAAVIMFASWVLQCKKQKRLYPNKRYYLLHLTPGVLLAITGLVLFAFLETEENYLYTHSAWHIAMSLSIVFLLPRRNQKGMDIRSSANSSINHANTSTNPRSGIVLNSYTGMANGSVTNTSSGVDIEGGDNPAYVPPD